MSGPRRGGPPPHGWSGPPPGHDARWWRRRFLRFAVAAAVIWIGLGIVFGATRNQRERDRGGPPGVLVVGVVGAVGATVFAYRRLARPVSSLLEGAERIGAGEYATRVDPHGPRSVRTLGHAFNDMAARLDASESARQRFLADVTHELRTPLTVLQGEIELQLDGVHPRDDERLHLLLDQTRTLDRLVEDLRTLASGDAGQLVLHPESVELGAVVGDAVAALAPLAGRGGVEVAVTAPASVVVDADPFRVAQVVTNVMTNAIRHTPPGGRVDVEVAAQGGAAVVTVSDTGPGIAGDPDRIFDRFARAADSGGSRLGLSIARQLVVAHHGTITAANRPEGGARITVTLPLPVPA